MQLLHIFKVIKTSAATPLILPHSVNEAF